MVGSINAHDLSLQLIGRLTNSGYFGVESNLAIRAAQGIDNQQAQLRAGGSVKLSGSTLDNRGGTIVAGTSLWGQFTGDVDTDQGSLQAGDDLSVEADGNISARQSQIASNAGKISLDAGGNPEFDTNPAKPLICIGRVQNAPLQKG